MSTTITELVQLTTIDCGQCGATYAINERYRRQCEEEGKIWHCPYCQIGWGYFGSGENARLRRELEEKQRQLTAEKCEVLRQKQNREVAEKALDTTLKSKARLKRRIQNGVCPCCNRTFQNLARHMQQKHPQPK